MDLLCSQRTSHYCVHSAVLGNHSVGYNFYVDDTQIYISRDRLSCRYFIYALLGGTVFEGDGYKLFLNHVKTEFLLLYISQQRKQFDWLNLSN